MNRRIKQFLMAFLALFAMSFIVGCDAPVGTEDPSPVSFRIDYGASTHMCRYIRASPREYYTIVAPVTGSWTPRVAPTFILWEDGSTSSTGNYVAVNPSGVAVDSGVFKGYYPGDYRPYFCATQRSIELFGTDWV
jgi:hypothetical protein